MRGCDYSEARPGGAAIRADGCEFVIRYVPYGGLAKGLTADELADLRKNGLAVALVMERWESRITEGRGAGQVDAVVANDAIKALGMPADLPVFFACDFNALPQHYAAIGEYLRGAAGVLGVERVGLYGHNRILQFAQTNSLARWYWQCLAWSSGTFADRHVYQGWSGETINDGSVDINEAYPDKGLGWLWLPAGGVTGGLSVEDKARLDRLERLIGGYGVQSAPGTILGGEEALAYADKQQWSAFLGIAQARQDALSLATAVQAQAQEAGIPVDAVIAEITKRLAVQP